jgi:DNA-binding HxlR family transcriptional regulator
MLMLETLVDLAETTLRELEEQTDHYRENSQEIKEFNGYQLNEYAKSLEEGVKVFLEIAELYMKCSDKLTHLKTMVTINPKDIN